MLRKFRGTISVFFMTMLLTALWMSAHPSAAEENWSATTWDGDAGKLKQLSASRGITSGDVLWANDYADLPPKGETLLVPNSKADVLPTWMEVQNRKSGPKPIVTVKLHGVPAALRGSPTEPPVTVKLHGALRLDREQTPTQPSTQPLTKTPTQALTPTPIVPAPPKTTVPTQTTKVPAVVPSSAVKSMTVVVSGDTLIVATPKRDAVQEKPSSKNSADPAGTLRSVTLKATPETLASLPPLILPPSTRTPPPAAPTPSGKMMWPVSGKISSGFGRRGKRHFHAGIDIPMPQGTPIAAARDGIVLEVSTAKSKKYRGYGNTVLIDHGNGIATMYAHCQSISVKVGQRIKQGDTVGLIGNTGRTTTHHIHFEVRKNGKPVDPVPYLTPR
jgi:murein DD-endopeptidase MepM/ murein hydrolase activator NlpD